MEKKPNSDEDYIIVVRQAPDQAADAARLLGTGSQQHLRAAAQVTDSRQGGFAPFLFGLLTEFSRRELRKDAKLFG